MTTFVLSENIKTTRT